MFDIFDTHKFPCQCGHTKEDHYWNNAVGRYCSTCVVRYIRSMDCICEQYRPDNLKYLESKLNG